MRKFVVGFFAVIGFFSVLLVAAGIWLTAWFLKQGEVEALADSFVIELDLRGAFPANGFDDPLQLLGKSQDSLDDVLLKLMAVKNDERVDGMLIRLAETAHGNARALELWSAIDAVAKSGKPVAVWADSFGEVTPGGEGYLIATAASTIALQPSGFVGLYGVGFEIPFFAEFLSDIGIEAEIFRRADYKTAFDSFSETGLTAANAEMMNDLADGLYANLVSKISTARELSLEQVRTLIDQAPLSAVQAKEAGLIDELAYWREFRADFLDSKVVVDLSAYDRRFGGDDGWDNQFAVAVLQAQGNVVRGRDEFGASMGADSVVELLATAKDSDYDAFVLRLDTGGGSAVASDTIARELENLRKTGRPVVVSMGNAAASGGYWIAAVADGIVAQPSTFTGSIGVIAGKPVAADLLASLNINVETVARGDAAAIWSPARASTPSQKARLDGVVQSIYERFTQHVARGREMTPQAVEELAQGRVWLGEQALELGLVDRLGGLAEAIELAQELAERDVGEAVAVDILANEPDWMRYLAHFDFLIGTSLTAWIASAIENYFAMRPAEAPSGLPAYR